VLDDKNKAYNGGNKMKKRIFGVLIAICILIGVAPLRVAAAPEEQFSLQVGETYYFDLTGECKNDGMIPYTGYVPFTYVGTIEAYVIKGTEASHNSQTYLHSLFIADEGMGLWKGWNLFNSAGLIYGKDYTTNGITYTLRAPSGGDTAATGDRTKGSPGNNEWDVIVEKDSSLIKKKGDFYSCVQEYRIIRGGQYGFQNRTNGGWASDDVLLRPVLELPQDLAYDAMKPVTLYLNGMTIGSGENASAPEKIKIVVKAGETYPAPTAAGLTPPIEIIGTELLWADNDGNFYKPGDPVPADVNQLTASWFRPEPGPRGEKGEDGEDGVTPQLKIGDDNLWYVSYDGGLTWTSLGVKATGDKGDKGDKGDTGNDGKNGIDGRDGKDGVGIADVALNDAGELIVTLTDGTVKNLGKITGTDGKDGKDSVDGISVSNVTVDKSGNIVVTLTDGSTYQAGSVPVTGEEIQSLKIMAGVAIGGAVVSLVGVLSGVGYALLRRKKPF